MTKLRNIVITDNTTGVPAGVNSDNQLYVESEIVDASGKNYLLTPNSNAPVEIKNADGSAVDVQHPLPTNSDSTYVKNINTTYSDNGDFAGSVLDYFDSLKSVNCNATADNPKIIKLWFNRTIYSHAIGFGCDNLAKNFGTSITIKLLGSGEAVRFTKTFTAGDPNSFLAEFGPKAFNGVILEFNTANEVCLSNLTVPTSIETNSTLHGLDPAGDVQEVQVTPDGYLSVSDTSSGLAIADGSVSGKSFIHKFGEAVDFDSGDGAVNIWDGANDSLFAGAPPMQYTYSSSDDIGTISSSNAGDTIDVEILGLDTNYDIVTQTVSLAGQADVLLSTNLLRVFRMTNVDSTDIVGVVYLRTNGSGQTSGVPNTANTVRAIINNGNNQTLMAIYTVPNGKTGYMRDFFSDIVGANKTSNYKITLKARPLGQVFQVKHVKGLGETGSSSVHHKYEEPEVFQAKTDIALTSETTDSPITGSNISGGFDIVLVDN